MSIWRVHNSQQAQQHELNEGFEVAGDDASLDIVSNSFEPGLLWGSVLLFKKYAFRSSKIVPLSAKDTNFTFGTLVQKKLTLAAACFALCKNLMTIL